VAILDQRRGRTAIVVLGAEIGGNANLVAAVGPDLVDAGLQARQLLHEAGKAIGGGAGGQGRLAFAGGKNAAGLDQALQLTADAVRSRLVRQPPFASWPGNTLG
jgi:alanyl-tRNA synthetase